MKTLETNRLILRDWKEAEAADMLEFYSDPAIWPRAGGCVLTDIAQCEQCIQDYAAAQETWAVVLKETGQPIGSIFLEDIGRHPGYREMEFVLSGAYHGRGYMTEAVKRVLEYAFGALNLEVVAACHYPDNVQSRRVIEKCGFTYEGTLRRYSKNGQDSVRYSITKEEWPTKKQETVG